MIERKQKIKIRVTAEEHELLTNVATKYNFKSMYQLLQFVLLIFISENAKAELNHVEAEYNEFVNIEELPINEISYIIEGLYIRDRINQ